jgi:hypothetical protein
MQYIEPKHVDTDSREIRIAASAELPVATPDVVSEEWYEMSPAIMSLSFSDRKMFRINGAEISPVACI